MHPLGGSLASAKTRLVNGGICALGDPHGRSDAVSPLWVENTAYLRTYRDPFPRSEGRVIQFNELVGASAGLAAKEVRRMPTSKSRTPADQAINAAEEAVRASLEAAAKIARVSLDASTEAARRVQQSLRDALDALTPHEGSSGGGQTRHRTSRPER